MLLFYAMDVVASMLLSCQLHDAKQGDTFICVKVYLSLVENGEKFVFFLLRAFSFICALPPLDIQITVLFVSQLLINDDTKNAFMVKNDYAMKRSARICKFYSEN